MVLQIISIVFSTFLIGVGLSCSTMTDRQLITDQVNGRYSGWRTNTAKRTIDLSEIKSGGPPKDGIPALSEPKTTTIADANSWLGAKEPVIAVELNGEARAYPLQILVWHEIVNDEIQGTPIAVTFCPLCYSALVFDRRLDGRTLSFGVTGMLRHSDMIMYDRETESWWQQFTGEAIVGDLSGKTLTQLPAQIVGFSQFVQAHPTGKVLSRETGHSRDYGRNPYAGYDDIESRPFLYGGKKDDRLPPMEKVVAVELNGAFKAYPYRLTRKRRVIYDRVSSQELVVFHSEGTASALDAAAINDSRDVGATGVFDPRVDGRRLEFKYDNGQFVDAQTQSRWNILGQAVSGDLKGKQLKRLTHGDYFAFAWLAFRPQTEIYRD